MNMNLLELGFDAVAKSLREFGYPDATRDVIKAAHARWRNGDPDNDIVARFAADQFADNPEIFGTPQPTFKEGDRVHYANDENQTGKVLEAKGTSIRVRWDDAGHMGSWLDASQLSRSV